MNEILIQVFEVVSFLFLMFCLLGFGMAIIAKYDWHGFMAITTIGLPAIVYVMVPQVPSIAIGLFVFFVLMWGATLRDG